MRWKGQVLGVFTLSCTPFIMTRLSAPGGEEGRSSHGVFGPLRADHNFCFHEICIFFLLYGRHIYVSKTYISRNTYIFVSIYYDFFKIVFLQDF